MRYRRIVSKHRPRQGAAAVEMALLLPVLIALMVGAADFAQIIRASLIVENCARNGAVYASYNVTQSTDTTGIQAAAQRDAGGLTLTVPTPTTGTTTVTGANADTYTYVDVTVNCNVTLFSSYLGITDPFALSSKVRMRVTPNP